MQEKLHTARSATAAIAAVLALGSTGLAAQDIGTGGPPPFVEPEAQVPAPPVSAPPEVLVPQLQPEPAPVAPQEIQSAPSVQTPTLVQPQAETPLPAAPQAQPEAAVAPAPVTTEAAPPPAAVPAAPPASSPQSAQNTPVAAEAVDPVVEASEQVEAFASPYAAPAGTFAPAETTVDPAPAGTGGLPLAALIGLLLVPVLALLAFLPFRRRKKALRKPEHQARPLPARQPAATPPAYAAAAPVERQPEREPVATYGALSPSPAAIGINSARNTATVRSSGAAVELPEKMPARFEERDALLKRMIAARPDRANPFRSVKARARRAKLILQSLGRSFAHTDPHIDLSQYPNNWPEVARRRFPQAA